MGGRSFGSTGTCAARIWRTVVTLTVSFSLMLAGGEKTTSAQSNEEEYRVKAAFLFHFAQLVDWPEETLTRTANSLFLCTLGEDPFQGVLDSTVAGKMIGNRTIQVRHLEKLQDLQVCQIVFFGKNASNHIPILLADLRKAPVLTVGETADFFNAGGMICFLLEQNKVRFEINLDAAGSAKLKIGSRLLILAQRVVAESRGK